MTSPPQGGISPRKGAFDIGKLKKRKRYDETYMYQLIFKNKTIKCNSLQEWHKQVVKLEKQGLMYKKFKREGERYKFYYV